MKKKTVTRKPKNAFSGLLPPELLPPPLRISSFTLEKGIDSMTGAKVAYNIGDDIILVHPSCFDAQSTYRDVAVFVPESSRRGAHFKLGLKKLDVDANFSIPTAKNV